MATLRIRLSAGLAGGSAPREMDCSGSNVGQVLADLVEQLPVLRHKVFRSDGTTCVAVFINGIDVRRLDGLETAVAYGDDLRLIPPIPGG